MPPLFWGENRRDICELQFDPVVDPGIKEEDHTYVICDIIGCQKSEITKNAERSDKNG